MSNDMMKFLSEDNFWFGYINFMFYVFKIISYMWINVFLLDMYNIFYKIKVIKNNLILL